jgi:hypothetical protein
MAQEDETCAEHIDIGEMQKGISTHRVCAPIAVEITDMLMILMKASRMSYSISTRLVRNL